MNWNLIFSNALYSAIAVNAIGYALIAIGLNVHFGYTGLLNFGMAGFAAIGAYAVAVPVSQYGWSLWATIPLIFLGGILLGLLLGIPTLRLRADYLAIVTIATAEIIRLFLSSERFRWLFGGLDGLQQFTGGLQDVNPFDFGRRSFLGMDQTYSSYDAFMIVIGWSLVAADPAPFLGLGLVTGAWLEAALPALIEAQAPQELAGTALLHLDVRSDNLCFAGDRTLLVDWNHVSRGNPMFDVAAWLPSLALEGGPEPDVLRPEAGVFAAALAVFLAVFFAAFLARRGAGAGSGAEGAGTGSTGVTSVTARLPASIVSFSSFIVPPMHMHPTVAGSCPCSQLSVPRDGICRICARAYRTTFHRRR